MVQIDFFPDSTATQITLLLLAFVLSALVGLERQRRLKSAGLRTHTLVGVGSAVFTLVSAYGFSTVIGADLIVDPSRIAAQIVTGIGFLGAGVIFVRQNVVNGLTTAASIWVTAAIGMACGAGMPVLAIIATLCHFAATTVLPLAGRRVPYADKDRIVILEYKDGQGVLRAVLSRSTQLGYEASLDKTRKIEVTGEAPSVEANMRFGRSTGPVDDLIEGLTEIKGVISVQVMKDEND